MNKFLANNAVAAYIVACLVTNSVALICNIIQ